MQPRLAILDEPDSGIDVLSQVEIEKIIRKLAENGSAVLLITHREELLSIADTASLMCAGQILFNGKASDTRQYYSTRCRYHLESLGAQPWDPTNPEAQAALTSNSELTLPVFPQKPEGENEKIP
jgi:Fe-S cluster assembly ATP-binding protein